MKKMATCFLIVSVAAGPMLLRAASVDARTEPEQGRPRAGSSESHAQRRLHESLLSMVLAQAAPLAAATAATPVGGGIVNELDRIREWQSLSPAERERRTKEWHDAMKNNGQWVEHPNGTFEHLQGGDPRLKLAPATTSSKFVPVPPPVTTYPLPAPEPTQAIH